MSRKVKKEYACDYKYYTVYKITDAIGQVYYMANSYYLTTGCVTCTGDTLSEVKYNIDKILQRIKLFSTLYRKR